MSAVITGRVGTIRIASADFAALAYKDPDVLYFVDADSQSMDEAQVYLGEKLLGIDPAALKAMFQGVATFGGDVVAIGTQPGAQTSNTTSYHEDVSLADFGGATAFELSLHATLQNPGQSPVNVEVWMERGYYEKFENEGKEEFIWHTEEHIAATQVYIPSYSGHSLNATCCANIAGQLIGPYPSEPCQYVRVCFSATGPINICPATPQNNLPKATALTILCWTPVTVA